MDYRSTVILSSSQSPKKTFPIPIPTFSNIVEQKCLLSPPPENPPEENRGKTIELTDPNEVAQQGPVASNQLG